MNKTEMKSANKPRQSFDDAFKREAVRLWKTSGKSAAVAAQELGILPERLYAWQARYAPPTSAGKPGTVSELQAQLEAAQREIRLLTQQRDILKKTLGIISEPLPNATNGLK